MRLNQRLVNKGSTAKDTTRGCRIPQKIARRILATPGASTQIAKIAGCSKTYVSMALNGHASASERLLDAIGDYSEAIYRETLLTLARTSMEPWLKGVRDRQQQRGGA